MDSSPLRLYNSLTRNKYTIPSNNQKLTWYNCGPTVYDHSHIGHARSYMTLDIIRRILKDYFHYDILYVMNITDIDDKIIKKARQAYLFKKYSESFDEEILKYDIASAVEFWKAKLKEENEPSKIQMINRIIASGCEFEGSIEDRLINCRDLLSEFLDDRDGSSIKDNSIFIDLPRYYEEDFFQDMKNLNIMEPDVVTRVSEYIPQIIAFIEKIIKNGYAYESNNSVYFDTVKFGSSKHKYGKLMPEAIGDSRALNEGEGALSVNNEILRSKKHPNDFALWKCSKAGEPSWNSPWGKGRPGWHIECSTMACDVLGEKLDFHSGGIDLRFPHHENEIAQSEAYFDTASDWVSCFLHTGHLTISGCKMSKSLKNFITIKEALKSYTSVQLRIAFLLHTWHEVLDYSECTLHDAITYEKFVYEFFLTVKDSLRSSIYPNQWTKDSEILYQKLHLTKAEVHEALCDNIDTRRAMMSIKELITGCNIYLKDNINPNPNLLKNIINFINRIFGNFGLNLTLSIEENFKDDTKNNQTEYIFPYVQVLANFREKVRLIAKDIKQKDILNLCDDLRDKELIQLGVRLEDKEVKGIFKTVVKLVDKELLLKEKEEKIKMDKAKKEENERKKKEQDLIKNEKELQRKIPPNQIFINETEKYSKFDEKGIPTHDVDGQPITKSQRKKLQKLYEYQEKKYSTYLLDTSK